MIEDAPLLRSPENQPPFVDRQSALSVLQRMNDRNPDGFRRIRARLLSALDESADPDRALTQAITGEIEAHVRAWPEQWAWNHRRWLHPPQEAAVPPAPGKP